MPERMTGTLYIVATPIGNLEDITQRALRILGEVDIVACEDTRRTRVLLNHFGIKTKTLSYHEHNERERAEQISELLLSGKNVALVSDAGTPLINDPGFRVTNAAIELNLAVVPIPGPTAFVGALVASGLPSDKFFFAGFLPARANARREKLEELKRIPATLVLYEAPHRIAAMLKDALDVLGNRQAAVARELTKIHEEIVRGSLRELSQRLSGDAAVRGEIVLVISGAAVDEAATGETEPSSRRLIERVSELERDGLDAKAALKKAARELGMKRAEAYRVLVAQKNRLSK
ncbi:MAG: rRNA (cytidine1402-2-O)-methyltransferase [Blastocatellia bacterium]|jgi:16S rRNA (cytidine1402-2'-O)-methyltransferase|nr:rRNA (cytidine1402-2-O)-methyltransferase [Blastocatellia bacterium]